MKGPRRLTLGVLLLSTLACVHREGSTPPAPATKPPAAPSAPAPTPPAAPAPSTVRPTRASAGGAQCTVEGIELGPPPTVRGRVLVAVSEGVALAAWRSGAREVQLQPLGPDGQPTGTASGVPVPGPSPQPIDLFVWGARAVLVTVDDTRADASVHATVLSHDGRPVAAPRPVPYDLLRPPPHVDLASRLGLPADAGTPAQPATRDDLDLILEREASGARLLRVLPSAGASAVGASTPLPDDVPVTGALAWQGRHWLLGNASTPATAAPPRVYRVSCLP